MLFDFFKRNKEKQEISVHLKQFQYEFSLDQKRAIMQSLFVVANVDGKFHRKEVKLFNDTAKLLDYKMKDTAEDTLLDIISIDKEQVKYVLNKMNTKQKDWYILTIFGMIWADGKALDIEFNHGIAYLDAIGITEEYAMKILKKSELIAKAFKL
jgi:uncharacterized tellurite resistance protein B-like protein